MSRKPLALLFFLFLILVTGALHAEDIIWKRRPVSRSVPDVVVNNLGPGTENDYALAQIFIPTGGSDSKLEMQQGLITSITTFFDAPAGFPVGKTAGVARLNFIELGSGELLPDDSIDPDDGFDIDVEICNDGTEISVTPTMDLNTLFAMGPAPGGGGCGELPLFGGPPFRIKEGVRYFIGLTPIIESGPSFSAHQADVADSTNLVAAVRATNPPGPPVESWDFAEDEGDGMPLGVAIEITGITNSAPRDFYLSFSDIGDGDAATSVTSVASTGDLLSAYIWVDENFSIDTGASVDIFTSLPGIVEFTAAETFQADILNTIGSAPGVRWEDTIPPGFGATGDVTPDFVDALVAIRVVDGTGILPTQITGSTFFDALHDDSSNAFLFGRVDMEVVGMVGETVEISLAQDDLGIVDGGVLVNPEFGSIFVQIGEPKSVLLGDVNQDGTVDLLDVSPFVTKLTGGTFCCEADVNEDGVVDLLDVSPFVALLTGS